MVLQLTHVFVVARYFANVCAEKKIPFSAFGRQNEIRRSSEDCLEIQHEKRLFPIFGVDEVKNFFIFYSKFSTICRKILLNFKSGRRWAEHHRRERRHYFRSELESRVGPAGAGPGVQAWAVQGREGISAPFGRDRRRNNLSASS